MTTEKKTTTKKRGVRRRRPDWEKQQAEKMQILETENPPEHPPENPPEQTVKEAIPPKASLVSPPESTPVAQPIHPIGSHRDNAIVINDAGEINRALSIFFQTQNPNDIFIKRETVTKHNGHSFKVVSAEGPKGKHVQLWFDVTSLAIVL